MGAITLEGVLRAEHDMLQRASDEWLGMGNDPKEDLQWVLGVLDFANKLVEMIEGTANGK